MGSPRKTTGSTWRTTSGGCTSGWCRSAIATSRSGVSTCKGNGKLRPLGISAAEDKIVQDALREVLQAVYEQDFLDCSYGFRPGRSAHDAIRALHRAAGGGGLNWVLEADIESFFDRLDRT